MKHPAKTWLCGLVLFLTQSARAAELPGHELFSAATLPDFKIEIAPAELEKLKRDNRVYAHAVVTVDGKVFQDVAVRLKGHGSFRPVTDRPSFAVKFDGFVPGQKLFGLSKLLLNNSSQDDTLLSEYLAASLFRDAGVPSARVIQARVALNGRDVGFYVLIEAMNKTFLKQHFQNPDGVLYEGSAKDVDQTLEHDGGPPSDQADLRALVAAARLPPAERLPTLRKVLDIDRFNSFLAMSTLIAQHDSYQFNRNNYRIYHDPQSDQFVMIPHGVDGSFTENNFSIRPPTKYVLAKAVLEPPAGRELYRSRFGVLFTNVFDLSVITNRLDAAAARLTSAAHSDAERTRIQVQTAAFQRRVNQRHDRVAAQLHQPEPPRLAFDATGAAALNGWEPEVNVGTAALEKGTFENQPVLHTKADSGLALGVWRSRAILEPGRYRFVGRLRTAEVTPPGPSPAIGAALRTFKLYTAPRRTIANGDWRTLEFRFTVNLGEEEVEFMCEFQAPAGEAWFDDTDSLKVIKE